MSEKPEKKRYSVTLTNAYVEALNCLVEVGIYLDHQDAIRDSMRRLFQFHGIEPFAQNTLAVKTEEKG